MNKVLIADNVSDAVFKVFEENNIEYVQKTGLSEDELAREIVDYVGLVIRSAVTVTDKIISSAENLRVIGRPGVGVDNVDLDSATKNNIVVMNTPLGNVQATAELTFSIIHALMRKITEANESMHSKKWEKKNFIGSEMLGKTIGIVGFGNIGKKISEIWKLINKNEDKHNFSFISPEFSPPNGESFLEQSKRVEIWPKKLKLKAGQSILIITHAGTIRAILSHALQIKPDFAIGLEVTYQSYSVLEMLSKKDNKHKGGQFRLLSFNNVI